MKIQLIIILIAIPLFIVSAAGYIYVKLRLKPNDDSELDNFSWEFEDQHPKYKKYSQYSQLTFIGVIISMLLLFLALIF